MDPEEYRDARWHALLRAAADLGVPDEDAPAVVQRVLDDRHRAIRRADDPDPLVHEALRDAIHPPPPRDRRTRWAGAALLVTALAVVGVVVAVTRPAEPPTDRLGDDQVPSLFGYDAEDARALLEERGLDVTVRPFRSCETLDRVVGSDPAPGQPVGRGDPVLVLSAVPADVTCLADYVDRETAWRLLDFANGRGPAPIFADRVFVYPGDGERLVLDGARAAERDGWAETGILDGLRAASEQVTLVTEHPLQYAVPAIRIVGSSDRVGSCGVPDPAVAGAGDAFSVLVRPPDREGCGVRVDVFRDGGAIEAVAYYPG